MELVVRIELTTCSLRIVNLLIHTAFHKCSQMALYKGFRAFLPLHRCTFVPTKIREFTHVWAQNGHSLTLLKTRFFTPVPVKNIVHYF